MNITISELKELIQECISNTTEESLIQEAALTEFPIIKNSVLMGGVGVHTTEGREKISKQLVAALKE